MTSSPGPTRLEKRRVLLEDDEGHGHRGHEAGDVLVGDRDLAARRVDLDDLPLERVALPGGGGGLAPARGRREGGEEEERKKAAGVCVIGPL